MWINKEYGDIEYFRCYTYPKIIGWNLKMPLSYKRKDIYLQTLLIFGIRVNFPGVYNKQQSWVDFVGKCGILGSSGFAAIKANRFLTTLPVALMLLKTKRIGICDHLTNSFGHLSLEIQTPPEKVFGPQKHI